MISRVFLVVTLLGASSHWTLTAQEKTRNRQGRERPAQADTNDPRFHARLLEVAGEYSKYGRVDADARMALLDCRAPSKHLGVPRVSQSSDKSTHGKKVYYLYAKRRQAYRDASKSVDQRGQVLVKETWQARPVDSRGPIARDGEKVVLAARDGDQHFIPGQPGALFVMYRYDDSKLKDATDAGWVYGTISVDRKTVTSAGRVASCMGCHQSAPHGRLYGLKDLTPFLKTSQKPAGRGDEFVARSAKRALERYLAEIDEIDNVAARRKANARQRFSKALDEAEKFEAEQGARYRGMLGYYTNTSGRIPFIMLSVPNGNNVFRDYAKSVMNGRIDLNRALHSFHTRGHIMIPRDGTYYLEASRGHWDMKLNDVGYNLSMLEGHPKNRYAADVKLTAGLYEIDFSVGNNGGQLSEGSIRIVDKQTKNELPIFVYESELKEFWNDLQFGVELIETSKWTREENRLPSVD